MSKSLPTNSFISNVMAFLQASPTPFHAVQNMATELNQAGFSELRENAVWQLKRGEKYFVVRNDASLIAFVYGNNDIIKNGLRIIGAHSDSPCLKVKPNPEISNKGYFQLGVEVYGGVLMNPWFDRDLSLAGRVTYVTKQGALGTLLVDFEKPLAIIPSLAIHLDRDVNSNRNINAQQHLPPLLFNQASVRAEGKTDFRTLLLEQINEATTDVEKVLDYELSFYDVQPPSIIGYKDEFMASARLDNLLSCYVGLQALLSCNGEQSCLLVCNDHEEVGSTSASGADGPMLKTVLERWMPHIEERARMLDASLMVSCDNAHALHPNYSDKHDSNHGPVLNGGPVIKVNANQRYASNSETQAMFRHLCDQEGVPVQTFVARSDMGCGSTIGPITAAAIGVKTVDVGIPQLAMHSIRELCGVKDPEYLLRVLMRFCRGN
jgi:aspartyl aminopeptidase